MENKLKVIANKVGKARKDRGYTIEDFNIITEELELEKATKHELVEMGNKARTLYNYFASDSIKEGNDWMYLKYSEASRMVSKAIDDHIMKHIMR